MLRNLDVGCVVAQRNAPSRIQGALADSITHPTANLYFFIHIEFSYVFKLLLIKAQQQGEFVYRDVGGWQKFLWWGRFQLFCHRS